MRIPNFSKIGIPTFFFEKSHGMFSQVFPRPKILDSRHRIVLIVIQGHNSDAQQSQSIAIAVSIDDRRETPPSSNKKQDSIPTIVLIPSYHSQEALFTTQYTTPNTNSN
jgi:hypothetical protein